MDAPPESSPAHRPGTRPTPLERAGLALASVFGVGYLPVAPGTWGTLAAMPIAWACAGLSQWGYLALCVAVTVVAIGASALADRALGEHDSGHIVIDEVAGYLWTLVGVSRGDVWLLIFGFVLFRVADVVKPPPARAIDRRMGGGAGVVLDDVAAGVWAALALWGVAATGVTQNLFR